MRAGDISGPGQPGFGYDAAHDPFTGKRLTGTQPNQPPPVIASVIEAIERATVAAVAPAATEDFEGWLLAFDTGSVGRAKSAVPLAHSTFPAAVVDAIEQRYAARGYPPLFRIADVPALDLARNDLLQRGYAPGRPSLVQAAATESVRKISAQPTAEAADTPDAAWTAIFIGQGFDPIDGASRARTLSRTPGSVYASVREDGRAIACGAASFGYGWASIHGMRTEQARRGEGLAARVSARRCRKCTGDHAAIRSRARRTVARSFQSVVKRRWVLIEESEGTIPAAFRVLLVAWLVLIFASFG